MSVNSAGNSSGAGAAAAAQAAAEAQRRAAAEAQRRAAEAAKRAQEAAQRAAAARQAAESHRKATPEAEKRSQAAKQVLTQKKQQLTQATDPRARTTLQKEVAQAEQLATKAAQEASRAHTSAVAAEQHAQAAEAEVPKAQSAANEAARKAGQALPFPNILSTRGTASTFFGASSHPGAHPAALGADTSGQGALNQAQQLAADATYHKASSDPASRQVLDALDIHDGKALLEFAHGLGNGAQDEGLGRLKQALTHAAPGAQQKVLEGMGFLSPALKRATAQDPELQRMARGESPASARATEAEGGTTQQTAAEEPKPTAEEVALMPAQDKEALAAIGLQPQDLVGTGTAAEELIDAGRAALQGEWDTAAQHLREANAAAPQLAEKAVAALAARVPEPVSSLLKDGEAVKELLGAAPDVLAAVLGGDVPAALEKLASLEHTRDRLIELAAAQPQVAEALASLGISVDQLKQAGDALPELMRAAQAAAGGQWEQALTHLQEAWPDLQPALQQAAQSAFLKAAEKLPENHPARAYLTDPTLVKELIEAAPEALAAVVAGKPWDALEQLAGDEGLRNAFIDVAAKDPQFAAALESVGLTADDLKGAGEALPSLVRGLKAALANDWATAFKELGAAATAGSELAEKAILHLAESLPDDNPAKALLTDPEVVHELVAAGPEVLEALWNKDFGKAFQLLAGNPTLQDAFFDAALSDERVVQALETLGLSEQDVRDAGAAAPELIAAALAAKDGEWDVALEHLQAAASEPAVQELVAKLVSNAASHLPEGSAARELLSDPNLVREFIQAGGDILALTNAKTMDEAISAITGLTSNPELVEALKSNPYISTQLERLGISDAEFDQALAALPDLLRAGEALGREPLTEEDIKASVRHLAAAAEKAPELGADLIGRVAEQLPETHPARQLLTDEKLMAEVLQSAPELVESLLSGSVDSVLTGLATLVEGDEGLRTALAENDFVEAQLEALGITDAAQQEEAIGALPDVLEAAAALASDDPNKVQTALQHLLDAAGAAPNVVANLVGKLAEKLDPNSPAYKLLTDENLVREALEAGGDIASLLLQGKTEEALALLPGLTENTELVDAFVKNPWVAQQLGALGIDETQAKQAIALLPQLFAAGELAANNDWEGALKKLAEVGANLPEELKTLIVQKATTAAASLPDDNALKPFLSDPAVVGALLESAPEVIAKLAEPDYMGAIALLGESAELRNAVIDVAWGDGTTAFAQQLAAFGLTEADIQAAGEGLPALMRGLSEVQAGNWEAAAAAFAEAGEAVLPAVTKAISHWASNNPDLKSPLRELLMDQQLMSALLQSGDDAAAAIDQLANGHLDEAMQTIFGSQNGELMEALKGSPAVRQLLTDVLGIPAEPPELMTDALNAAPSLLLAAEALLQQPPDMAKVAEQLGFVAEALSPDTLGFMGGKLAAALGWDTKGPPFDTFARLLSDGALLKELLTNSELHGDVVAALQNGDVDALSRVLTNPAVSSLAANALWGMFGGQLQQLGFTDPSQITDLIKALPSLINAFQAAQAGQWGTALDELGKAAGQLPPDVLRGVANRIAAALPENLRGLGGLLAAAVDVVTAPGGMDALKNLVNAFNPPNIDNLVAAIQGFGPVIDSMGEEQLLHMLDALGTLPGGIGEIFSDPELNKAMVKSGSLKEFFTGVGKLVQGDLQGALKDFGEAAKKLLTWTDATGDDIAIPGTPITRTGLKNLERLFMRVFDALPNRVKTMLEQKIADLASNVLGLIPIIGDGILIIQDGIEFWREMEKDDTLGMILAGASGANHAAGFIPGADVITGPLSFAIGVLSTLEDMADMVGEMGDSFGSIFAGFETDPDKYIPHAIQDAGESWPAIEAYGITEEQYVEMVSMHPELAGSAHAVVHLIETAKALGIPPSQFGAYLDELARPPTDFKRLLDSLPHTAVAAETTGESPIVNQLALIYDMTDGQIRQWVQNTTGKDIVDAVIDALYWHMLGRAPDDEGRAHYREVIEKELSRDHGTMHNGRVAVTESIWASDEYDDRH